MNYHLALAVVSLAVASCTIAATREELRDTSVRKPDLDATLTPLEDKVIRLEDISFTEDGNRYIHPIIGDIGKRHKRFNSHTATKIVEALEWPFKKIKKLFKGGASATSKANRKSLRELSEKVGIQQEIVEQDLCAKFNLKGDECETYLDAFEAVGCVQQMSECFLPSVKKVLQCLIANSPSCVGLVLPDGSSPTTPQTTKT